MENNHIDQQFNEASKRSEEPTVFPGFDKVWEKIEQKLDQKKEKKKIIPVWFPYGIAASLMIGMGALYFLNKKDTIEQSAKPAIAENKIASKLPVDTHITAIDLITKKNIQKEKDKAQTIEEKIIVYNNTVPEPLRIPNTSSVGLSPMIYRDMKSSDGVKNSDEVIVTALGVKKDEKSLSASSPVAGALANNLPQANVLSSLQGSVQGLQVSASGSRSAGNKNNITDNIGLGYFNDHKIMIRGMASVNPGNTPLYIINGKVAEADDLKRLDPNKIENVQVLKNNILTALYGSRALNGVVVVTTKKLSGREKKRAEKLQQEISKQKTMSVSSDESYDAFVENPFEFTQNQPLSTFSVDVDNASYSNIRRMINSGRTVNKNAVRIEEMVNYFKYDYPQPGNGEPFSINTEYGNAPWNPKHKLLKIGIQGKNIPMDKLPASNIVFLIDVSGSMNEPNKLPLLKSSLTILLDQLRPQDKVGIVVYAGSAGVVLPSTSAAEKSQIINALDKLQAGGSTAGGQGIELAYKLARENFIKGGNNRVVLATDGDFNVGASSKDALETLIEEKRKTGIFLTCLGYGMGNYKDNTMETLADKGNGNYAYIDHMQEANKFLGREFAGNIYTIAKDVKIQIEFNPEFVQSYRLIGYENRKLRNEDFTDDKIDAGELGSGHTVTALYEIIPADVQSDLLPKNTKLKYSASAATKNFGNELATVKFRYKRPNEENSREIIEVIKKESLSGAKESPDFKFASSVAWFGLVLRDSKLIKNKDLKEIENLAKEGRSKDTEGYRAEFIRLVESYKALRP